MHPVGSWRLTAADGAAGTGYSHACVDRGRGRDAGGTGKAGCGHWRVRAGDAGGLGEGVAGDKALAAMNR